MTSLSVSSNCFNNCAGGGSLKCGGNTISHTVYENEILTSTAISWTTNNDITTDTTSVKIADSATTKTEFTTTIKSTSGLVYDSTTTGLTSLDYISTKITTINSETNQTTPIDYTKPVNLGQIMSQLFSSNNFDTSQLLEILDNKTFLFDLKSDSNLPTQLLTSTLDISNCVSNCSNYGVCKLSLTNQFICTCDLDHSGSKCDKDLRPCSSLPCLNYLQCDNVLNGTIYNQVDQQFENYYGYKRLCIKLFELWSL